MYNTTAFFLNNSDFNIYITFYSTQFTLLIGKIVLPNGLHK